MCTYLENDDCVDEGGGLKLHVEDERDKGVNGISTADWELVGEVFPPLLNKSELFESLIVAANDSGLRTTEPGVIVGSSSIFFIWLP